jgi:putative Holliday junction resolvase
MRWLCLDPGAKRTGVAISSPEGTFAVPLTVLEHDAGGPLPEMVERLMREHRAEGLVIGLPLSMDGSMSSQTRAALEVAVRLASHFDAVLESPPGLLIPANLPEPAAGSGALTPGLMVRILLWDERLSSWEAQRMTTARDAASRKKAGRELLLDAHAAAVILQSFLDAHAPESSGLDGAHDQTADGADSAG